MAHNLCGLGARAVLVGKIGNDPEGKILSREFRQKGIDTRGIFIDKTLPTICKTRVIAQHQQVVRIDRERTGDAPNKLVSARIMNFVRQTLGSCDAVILSDYGKGLITPELVNFVRDLALTKKKIITIDPKSRTFQLLPQCHGYYTEFERNRERHP